tara:strand:- start:336 stop:653 length:318 start_codon:yes stop_codon:yes gene_type:complete
MKTESLSEYYLRQNIKGLVINVICKTLGVKLECNFGFINVIHISKKGGMDYKTLDTIACMLSCYKLIELGGLMIEEVTDDYWTFQYASVDFNADWDYKSCLLGEC